MIVTVQDPAPAPPPVRLLIPPTRPISDEATTIPGPGLSLERPSIITNPQWAVRPQLTDREFGMVAAALEQGISGEAVVSCGVNADGRLHDCTVVETPAGHRFGEAALSAARTGQIDVSRFTPPSEATVHFTVRFRP